MARKTKKQAIKTVETEVTTAAALSTVQINRDVVAAVLIVSLLVNLFVLTAWVTLQVTTVYDPQVAAFLFNR